MNAHFDPHADALTKILDRLKMKEYMGEAVKAFFSEYMSNNNIHFSKLQKDHLIHTRNHRNAGEIKFIPETHTAQDWENVMADHFSHVLIQSRNFIDTILDPEMSDDFRSGCMQNLRQARIIMAQNISNYRVYFSPEKGDPLDRFLTKVSEDILKPLQELRFEDSDFEVDAPVRHFMEDMTSKNWKLMAQGYNPYSEYDGNQMPEL